MIKATFSDSLYSVFCLFLIGFNIFCMPVFGQTPDLKFEHFIDEKGLTQNSVMKVLQDTDGYLWLGTPNGLYRYDGQRFVTYRHQPNNPNSLVNNSVFELELDAFGDLLIGTGRGLSKFNKLTQTFSTFPLALKDARITSICPEKDGGLWVGTLHSGLYYFNKEDEFGENPKHFVHRPNQSTSINSDQIHSLVKDKAGNLWVGTIKGLNKIVMSESQDEFVHFESLSESIKVLFLDKQGGLWIGLVGQRLINITNPEDFNLPKQNDFNKYSFNIAKPDTAEYGGIITIFETANGNLWLGIHGYGLYFFNPKNGEYKSYEPDLLNPESISSSNIETILIDKSNVLWVGTEEGGLNRCNLEQKDILFLNSNVLSKKRSLSNPSVNAVVDGEKNTIWVGTQNGLNRIVFSDSIYTKPKFEHYYYINKQLVESQIKIKQPVWSILKDKDKDYWLGTGEGITHMSVNSKTENVSFNATDIDMIEVFSSLEDSSGVLWFGSFMDGLVKWKKKRFPNSNKFDFTEARYYLPDANDKYSISGKEISCLYEDSKGNLWIGTLQGGLNLLIPAKNGEKDRFISYQYDPDNPNSLSNNSVFSIHEDKEGDYWIGTFGGGLNKMILSPNGNLEPDFIHYSEEQGLANDAVYGILEDDDGKLWLSTDNGISCFNPKEETFKNFTKEDGLQSNNFRMNAYFKNHDGYLFFGGIRGLNIFHPDNLRDNNVQAEPKITGFKIKNDLVEVGKEYNGRVIFNQSLSTLGDDLVKLKHHENTLTFEFAALHFAAPIKNKFKYQLEGFDNKWKISKGISFAHYTNLSPGDYTFNVKASNNDGVWNEVPAKIKFKIYQPYWLMWWAYVLYAILISGIIFGFVSYYRLQEKEKAAVRIQKEIEEVNRLKLQFFTNISHDFRTPITLILNPLEEILKNAKNNSSLHSNLKVIERNANYLLRLVNQLMEFRQIEMGETKLKATKSNIIDFVREITFSFRALASKRNIELLFDSRLNTSEVWFDWDKLEKILNNLIFNALKFTNDGGRVIVRVFESQKGDTIYVEDKQITCEYFKIEVEDNGAGIDLDQLPYVFQRFYQVNKGKKESNEGSGIGLAITKDLVDLHHGTIEVKSKVGDGSRFIIKLPIGNTHLSNDEMVEYVVPKPIKEEQLDEGYDFEEKGGILASSENVKYSILIVDDNMDIRSLVKKGLSNKYQIYEAENGMEALNIALKKMPDLVISDVLMPKMDGIEFCYELKNNIRTSHIPVVLLTALNSVEHRIEGLESGADAYIPKPFKMQLLAVRVDKLIESREAMRKRFQTEEKITPSKVTLNSIDREFLETTMELMEKNMNDESYWVEQLASDMNTSRSTFFRKLKKLTGQTPNDFIRIIRLKRAAQLLEQNQLSVSEVSYMVGFNDPNYFGKCFKKVYGRSPSRFVLENKV